MGMELNELKNAGIDEIYKLTSDLSDKVMAEFGDESQIYLNEDDYDKYLVKLEGELDALEL